jgi:hypothetical protein
MYNNICSYILLSLLPIHVIVPAGKKRWKTSITYHKGSGIAFHYLFSYSVALLMGRLGREEFSLENTSPDFDSIKQTNPYGAEYWSARDLAPLLGYNKWERFEGTIKRAMTACQNTGNIVEDHFPGAGKPIVGGKGAIQHVQDYYLSRFACYLVAQNGDPHKKEIAAAQIYFAIATRERETSLNR